MIICIGTIFSLEMKFENPNHNSTWYSAMYHTFQIFVLNAPLPLGGPKLQFILLLLIYFIAPLFTIEIIYNSFRQSISYLLENRSRKINFQGHIVISGLGKLGTAVLDKWQNEYKEFQLVGVDINDHAFTNSKVKYYKGDINSEITQDLLNIKKARLLVSLTNDDVINLDTAERLKKYVPCIIQIHDIYLRGVLEKHMVMNNLEIVNSYEIAAKDIMKKVLPESIDMSKEQYHFIIGGYGNFGKMMSKQILERFELRNLDNFSIYVIDIKDDRKSEIEMFKSIYSKDDNILNDRKIKFLKKDIRNLNTWDDIYNEKESRGKKIIAILSTDNDAINISTTLSIAKISKKYNVDLKIMTRFFKKVDFLQVKELRESEGLERIEPFVFSEIVVPEIIASMERKLNIFKQHNNSVQKI